jgi:hypothetical protein
MTHEELAQALLRKFLNKAIDGKNTQAYINALAKPGAHLIKNIEAVHDSLYIVSAEGRYLDQRLADRDFIRPGILGLDDDIFRDLGIAVTNVKQIRSLINYILEVVYGIEYTRANLNSANLEPYALSDGDDLILEFDGQDPVTVIFKTDMFQNISSASAQEVSDAIIRELRKKGVAGEANVKNDGVGDYVAIFSPTTGPSSSITILGGTAQKLFKFPLIRSTTADNTTQWTLTEVNGGVIRAAWSAGANPNVGKVKEGDYVVITDSGFSFANKGTFAITKVQGGPLGSSYVEFYNPLGSAQTVTQGSNEGVLFFEPRKYNINSNINYASAFQSKDKILEVFLPAVTKVIRRERTGSVHLKDDVLPLGVDAATDGYYIWDPTKAYTITKDSCLSTAVIETTLISVDNSINIPDKSGFLCFGYGTSSEEGPVPYIGVPSSNTIQVSPSYKFKNIHPVGTDISLIGQNSSYSPNKVGLDYPFYLTDVTSGREYGEQLVSLVAATGITLVVYILYPNPVGLGKNEKEEIWG